MKNDGKTTIDKERNKRQRSEVPIHNEDTAARSEIDKVIPESEVTIPSIDNVINAKEWVDDGSKL